MQNVGPNLCLLPPQNSSFIFIYLLLLLQCAFINHKVRCLWLSALFIVPYLEVMLTGTHANASDRPERSLSVVYLLHLQFLNIN